MKMSASGIPGTSRGAARCLKISSGCLKALVKWVRRCVPHCRWCLCRFPKARMAVVSVNTQSPVTPNEIVKQTTGNKPPGLSAGVFACRNRLPSVLMTLAAGVHGKCAAFAQYEDAAATTSNFGKLHIQTNGRYDDATQMFAAGFAEAYVSAGGGCLWAHEWKHTCCSRRSHHATL